MFTNDSSSVGNDDDHCNIYDSSDQDVFELSDSPITLDDLISEHSNTRQGTSRLSVISSENIKESLPYIPQHLPRPTPIEWRRPDEYVFVRLPESVFSEGLYSRYWSPCAPLVWNHSFPNPLGGLSMFTNPVKAPDIHFSSSELRKQ
ncbi:unnamed protein product, partial [Schistosoma curassoni]|uniref:DDHD domain-containing protein n=1 Tax=Schistosoma curassoni TaxID=6186 RepID=A0A183JTM8_9TREM